MESTFFEGCSGQYDRLPVWRRRNLLHAQQQQQVHDKENSVNSTDFDASRNEKISFGAASNGETALLASERSINRFVNQRRVVRLDRNTQESNNFDFESLNRAKFSASGRHQFDVLDYAARNLSRKANSALPIRLSSDTRKATHFS